MTVSALTACGNNETAVQTEGSQKTESAPEGEAFEIGIIQLTEHPALDAAREGFEEGIKEKPALIAILRFRMLRMTSPRVQRLQQSLSMTIRI